MSARLDRVLVVTVRKSFWASPEAAAFPHRVYSRVFYGHSTNLLNSVVGAVRGLVAVWRLRPRVVLLGSVERMVPWFLRARRYGLLGGARLVVTNQLHLDDAQLAQVDRVVLYARPLVEGARPALRAKAVFAPLPADGDLAAAAATAEPTGRVFTGGGAGRDFRALIAAVEDTDVELELVTFAPAAVGPVPANVTLLGPMPVQEFLRRLAGSHFAAVALDDPDSPHGQTTVVQALALGKAVVATRSPGIVDYVEDGREGLLVEAGDVAGYRDAILRLARDDELRAGCEARARDRARDLTYAAFRERLVSLLVPLGLDAEQAP
jgi:glycosyltransferase involved in cell wall biosynthesis